MILNIRGGNDDNQSGHIKCRVVCKVWVGVLSCPAPETSRLMTFREFLERNLKENTGNILNKLNTVAEVHFGTKFPRVAN